MRLTKPSPFIQFFYPSLLWKMPEGEKKIYLTFDDGPHPEITPKVLRMLDLFNAKATFFCIGNNIEKYPETFALLKDKGHSIGNHTFNHEKGWNTKTKDYVEAVNRTNRLTDSKLFRPPYGKITSRQIRCLKKDFTIVGWTVIAYDWDSTLSAENCYNNVINKAEDGSIIAFHDSEKAAVNMLETLPRILKYFSEHGYSFCAL